MGSPLSPDETPGPNAPGTVFDVKPFAPDGGASHTGALLTLALGVAAAAVLGVVASLIGKAFYLVLLFPCGIGLGVGAAVHYGLKQGKVRDPSIGAMAGFLGGLVAMLTMHYCDYRQFLREIDSEIPGSGAIFEERSGFRGFMEMQAKEGVTIVSTRAGGQDRGMNLGYAGSIIYWLVEVGIVLGIVVMMGRQGASKPFCVGCEQWKSEIPLTVLHTSPQLAKSAVERGNVIALIEREQLSAGAGNTCQLKAYVCPTCTEAGEVEIAVIHETKNEKGEKQIVELTNITYPGTVIAAIKTVTAKA